MKDFPSILYKYCNESAIDIIENLRIKFTDPEQFGDIFDSYIEETEEYEINPLGADFYVAFCDRRTKLPLDPELIEFKSWLDNRRAAGILHPPGPMLLVEEFRNNQDKIDFLKGFRDGFRKSVDGILALSLTEKRDEIRMWDLYANGHRGFCLGLSTSARMFFLPSIYNLSKVNYRDKPFSGVREFISRTKYMTKSIAYADEREWRSQIHKDLLDEIDRDNRKQYFGKLGKDDILEVIFGYRCSEKLKSNITRLLPKGVRTFDCTRDIIGYSLSVSEV